MRLAQAGAALVLAALGALKILRRRQSCSLAGARAQWKLLLSISISMAVVYGVLYWLTGYLARAAGGS